MSLPSGANALPALLCLAVLALLGALSAHAAAQLLADGKLMKTNHYGIDLFQGPVLASTRVIGLAGAFASAWGIASRRSPRVALETESVPNWLKLRVGSYNEPTRFPSNKDGGRIYGTRGLDAKLFPFDALGLFGETRCGASAARWTLDAARDYVGWSVAIGVWH